MSTNYQDTRKLKYSGNRIAMMCPVCYHVAQIGNIEMKATVEAPPVVDPCIRMDFDHTGIMTYPQTGHEFESSQLIEVYCCEPCHGFNEPKMIALDGGIAQLIADLNKAGAYTVASCAGNHMFAGGTSLQTKAYILFLTPFTETMKNQFMEIEKKYREKLIADYDEKQFYKPKNLETSQMVEIDDLFPEDERYHRTGIYGGDLYRYISETSDGYSHRAIKEEYGPARVIREFFLNNPSPEVEAYCKANKAKFATLMDVYKKGVELCGTDEIPESAYPKFDDTDCFE